MRVPILSLLFVVLLATTAHAVVIMDDTHSTVTCDANISFLDPLDNFGQVTEEVRFFVTHVGQYDQHTTGFYVYIPASELACHDADGYGIVATTDRPSDTAAQWHTILTGCDKNDLSTHVDDLSDFGIDISEPYYYVEAFFRGFLAYQNYTFQPSGTCVYELNEPTTYYLLAYSSCDPQYVNNAVYVDAELPNNISGTVTEGSEYTITFPFQNASYQGVRLELYVDNTRVDTYPASGTIAPGQTVTVTLTTPPLDEGTHSLEIHIVPDETRCGTIPYSTAGFVTAMDHKVTIVSVEYASSYSDTEDAWVVVKTLPDVPTDQFTSLEVNVDGSTVVSQTIDATLADALANGGYQVTIGQLSVGQHTIEVTVCDEDDCDTKSVTITVVSGATTASATLSFTPNAISTIGEYVLPYNYGSSTMHVYKYSNGTLEYQGTIAITDRLNIGYVDDTHVAANSKIFDLTTRASTTDLPSTYVVCDLADTTKCVAYSLSDDTLREYDRTNNTTVRAIYDLPYDATQIIVANGVIYSKTFNDGIIRAIRFSDGAVLGTVSFSASTQTFGVDYENMYVYAGANVYDANLNQIGTLPVTLTTIASGYGGVLGVTSGGNVYKCVGTDCEQIASIGTSISTNNGTWYDQYTTLAFYAGGTLYAFPVDKYLSAVSGTIEINATFDPSTGNAQFVVANITVSEGGTLYYCDLNDDCTYWGTYEPDTATSFPAIAEYVPPGETICRYAKLTTDSGAEIKSNVSCISGADPEAPNVYDVTVVRATGDDTGMLWNNSVLNNDYVRVRFNYSDNQTELPASATISIAYDNGDYVAIATTNDINCTKYTTYARCEYTWLLQAPADADWLHVKVSVSDDVDNIAEAYATVRVSHDSGAPTITAIDSGYGLEDAVPVSLLDKIKVFLFGDSTDVYYRGCYQITDNSPIYAYISMDGNKVAEINAYSTNNTVLCWKVDDDDKNHTVFVYARDVWGHETNTESSFTAEPTFLPDLYVSRDQRTWAKSAEIAKGQLGYLKVNGQDVQPGAEYNVCFEWNVTGSWALSPVGCKTLASTDVGTRIFDFTVPNDQNNPFAVRVTVPPGLTSTVMIIPTDWVPSDIGNEDLSVGGFEGVVKLIANEFVMTVLIVLSVAGAVAVEIGPVGGVLALLGLSYAAYAAGLLPVWFVVFSAVVAAGYFITQFKR